MRFVCRFINELPIVLIVAWFSEIKLVIFIIVIKDHIFYLHFINYDQKFVSVPKIVRFLLGSGNSKSSFFYKSYLYKSFIRATGMG